MKRTAWLPAVVAGITAFLLQGAPARAADEPQPVAQVPVALPVPQVQPPAPTDVTAAAFPEGTDVEPEWRVSASMMNQTGVFVSREKTVDALKYDGNGKPVKGQDLVPESHGGHFGRLSMCRFTFQMDADWRPAKWVSAHTTLRLVRSLELDADQDAQVPEAGYGYTGDGNADLQEKRQGWAHDHYYSETQVREFYVNLRPAKWLDLRLGRQIVAWGETGNARLLDVVNPTDATWHFGAVESYEDQKMPLWMLRVMADVPALRGGLDIVWVPMLPLVEDGEDTVTVPLTFVGAWGLPTSPKQIDDSVSPKKVNSKRMVIPHDFGTDSRVGFRWKGSATQWVNYSLMYYWTHQMSPPIPTYLQQPIKDYDPATGSYSSRGTYDVELHFPRQHIVGVSLEGQVPFPLGTMLKWEAAVEPDRTYAMTSQAGKVDLRLMDNNTVEQQSFQSRRLLTFQHAFTLQQPFWIRPVNREEPFVLLFQFQHTCVPGVKDLDLSSAVVEVPGYDTTVVQKHQFRIVGALFTSFLKGTINPKIAVAYIPRSVRLAYVNDGGWGFQLKKTSGTYGSGFATFSLGFKVLDDLRATVAYNHFFGDEPYEGLGFYRDRNEVNFSVKYQF